MGSSGFLRDLGMEALYIHILEMMSLISAPIMDVRSCLASMYVNCSLLFVVWSE